MTADPFERAVEAAGVIASRSGVEHHEAVVVLGTGLFDAVQSLGEPAARLEFGEVPGFPAGISPGQRPEIWSVPVGNLHVLVYRGRLHLYEGHSAETIVHPLRTAFFSGSRTALLTNASGGIREDLETGLIVAISDHLNLTGVSPLSCLPAAVAPPREGSAEPPDVFVDLTDAWSARLRTVVAELEPSIPEGIYAQLPGPQFETPAEIRMLRAVGADLVGMSSVLEAIAARHLGMELLGLSVVTNAAAGLSTKPTELAPGSVVSAAHGRAAEVGRILREVLLRL
jgi:purine-nucleoside phosphorylase